MRPLLGFALLLALATSAHADPKTVAALPPVAAEAPATEALVAVAEDYRDDHFVVGVLGGAATPLGLVGVELGWRPVSFFEMSAGVGLGAGGAQAAVMPRFIARGRLVQVSIGVGISAGGWEWQNRSSGCFPGLCNGYEPQAGNTVEADLLWANGEVGLEFGKGKIFGRTAFGVGRVIAEGNVVGTAWIPEWLPYTSLTMGHRF